LLNSLIKEVKDSYDNFEPTRAGRAIQDFVTENLSNWYVRFNRKRYLGGEYNDDKKGSYQTLYTCLKTVSQLMAPIAPFYADKLYRDLTNATNQDTQSVHLAKFPEYDEKYIDKSLEERQEMAQKISSMVLGLRRKVSLKVRQPLQKIMIPALDKNFEEQINRVKDLILSEVNVKELEFLTDDSGILVKKIKPNFKTLGPKYGKHMKFIASELSKFGQDEISKLEKEGSIILNDNGTELQITIDDVEIISEDIPGWLVANDGKYTVALDITLTDELKQEGIAREFINRIQNIRKETGFEVTDRIIITIEKNPAINDAIINFKDYISAQTLADDIILTEKTEQNDKILVEIENDVKTHIIITKKKG
jgi:isoleucyl-tRNA synthetase